MLKNKNIHAIPLVQNLRGYQARYQADIHRLVGLVHGASPSLFLRELAIRPKTVGAIWPSSRQLAGHMAAVVSAHGDGLVVELGADTGSVTQALLDRGVSADRLWVVERSPAFVRHLRRRFPGLTVVKGDAADLGSLLPANRPVDTIVSSLPLRSLPSDTVTDILAQCRQCLRADSQFVQFTYAVWDRDTGMFDGFVEDDSRCVWLNLPPARVRVFKRAFSAES